MERKLEHTELRMENNRATNVLEELVRIMNLQDERVLAMWAEERKSGLVNPALDRAIKTQKDLLLSIPELLFDLGLEHCKRHIPRDHIVNVETRRAKREARYAEVVREAKEILEKRLGKRWQADAHLKERTTNAQTCPPADSSGTDGRAEPLAAVSSGEAVQGGSVLEKLGKLANIQDQRVLALRAKENKFGFVNPRLDGAIRLHTELLLSIHALTFDLGVEKYKRRSPRQQVADYWEEEQRRETRLQEIRTASKELISRHFDNLPPEQPPAHNDVDK
jgi:hypothetical protein